MRGSTLLALAAIAAGAALLAYSTAIGEGQVHLVLIFPVFTGTGLVAFAGMALILLGIFLGFLSLAGLPLRGLVQAPAIESVRPAPPQEAAAPPAKKFGGIVFLGPLPIVFGSSPRVTTYMLVLAIALTILLLAFFFLVLGVP